MKKIKFFMFTVLFAVMCAGFSSCEKDNDTLSSFSQNDIIGSWEFTGGSGYIKDNGTIVQQWQSISSKTEGDEQDVITDNFVQRIGDVWRFKEDGTITVSVHPDIFSYAISGNNLTFKGSWYDKWNDRQVTEVVFVIKELKADKLVVYFLGKAGSYDFYEEYIFKKVQ
jgi:hypothetical protein